ncbi:ABC transporter transmembrane domain-containing protein, partial [Actinoallomurus acaciae]
MTASRLVIRTVRYGGVWSSLLAVTSLLEAGAALLLPAVLGRAVDGGLSGSRSLTWPLVYAGLVAISMTGDALTDLSTGAGTAAATARLRHLFTRHVLGLGPSAGLPAGDLTSRAVTATADTAYAPSAAILTATAVVPPLGGVIALILLDPRLALAFGLGLPAIVALLRSFVRDTSAVVGRYLEAQGRIATRLVETLAGNRTVAAAGTAEREAARVLAPLPDLAAHGHATWRIQAATSGRGTLAVPLLQVAVLAVA